MIPELSCAIWYQKAFLGLRGKPGDPGAARLIAASVDSAGSG
jgi:hypothetical protein